MSQLKITPGAQHYRSTLKQREPVHFGHEGFVIIREDTQRDCGLIAVVRHRGG